MNHKVYTFCDRAEEVQSKIETLTSDGIEVIEFVQEAVTLQGTNRPYAIVSGYMIYKAMNTEGDSQ